MKLQQLVNKAKDKKNFADLKGFIAYCSEYLSYISDNLQATIISQNENHYRFYQYRKEGNFQITRPINSNLMYDAKEFSKASKEFVKFYKVLKILTVKTIHYDKF
jgi:hypothetical protein